MSVTGDISLLIGKVGMYGLGLVEQGYDVDLPAQPNITIVEGDTRLNQPATGYGLLYNRYALEDVRGLAPVGWRVAGLWDAETAFSDQFDYWRLHFGLYDLTQEAYNDSYPHAAIYKSPRTHPDAQPRWDTPNVSNNGYNETGFGALPGGIRTPGGNFHYLGQAAAFWALFLEHGGEDSPFHVASVLWNMTGSSFFTWKDTDFGQEGAWNAGMAIRLIKETPDGWTEGDKVTDGDGNQYGTVRITRTDGHFEYDEVWATSNLRTKSFINGDTIAQLQDAEAWAETEQPACCQYDNSDNLYRKVGSIRTANAYIERLLTKNQKILIEQESEALLLEQVLI